jgi:hypothetical protein
MSSFLTPNYPPPKRKSKEDMIVDANGFKDESTSIAGDKPKFNWTFFFIANAVMVIIFGVIIGTGKLVVVVHQFFAFISSANPQSMLSIIRYSCVQKQKPGYVRPSSCRSTFSNDKHHYWQLN